MQRVRHLAATVQRLPLEYVLVLPIVAGAVYLGIYHIKLIQFPYPAEMREGAMLFNMDFFESGNNLFDMANKPLHAEAYGIFYYVASYPFVRIFGNSLQTLRCVSGGAIVLTCAVVFAFSYRRSNSAPLSIAMALLCYPALLFYVTPVSRPDSVGTLLFFLAVAIPWWRNFSMGGLMISSFFVVAGFLTKAYFLLSFPIVFLYVALFVSLERSLAFLIFTCTLLSIVYVAFDYYYPTYFTDAIFGQSSALDEYSPTHAKRQLFAFLNSYWGLALVCVLWLLVGAVRGARWVQSASREKQRAFIAIPLPIRMNYFFFASICAVAACVYPLGGTSGAYLTYFYQLITPCLAVAVAGAATDLAPWLKLPSRISCAAILAVALANMETTKKWAPFAADYSEAVKGWNELEEFLTPYHHVLHVPHVAAILFKHHKQIYDSGHTQYFTVGNAKRSKLVRQVGDRLVAWTCSISESLRRKSFDLIVTQRVKTPDAMPAFASQDLVYLNYDLTGRSFTVRTALNEEYTLDIWVPKNKGETPDPGPAEECKS